MRMSAMIVSLEGGEWKGVNGARSTVSPAVRPQSVASQPAPLVPVQQHQTQIRCSSQSFRSFHSPSLQSCVDCAQETFIRNLAYVLGINPSRIRVAKVVPGSAVVNVEIGEDPTIKPEAPFNMTYNLDMDTSLQVAKQVG